MDFRQLHRWPSDQDEAVRIQNRFRGRIISDGKLDHIKTVAGVDTAFNHIDNILFAGICVFRFPDLIQTDNASASAEANFPYFPGFYAFREGPVILKAFERLQTVPDVVIFAGHGIAHPRRFGLASHLGLFLNLPAIGCARKKLVGQFQEPGREIGKSAPLYVYNEECGVVYRSRYNVKPVFISPGHKCDLRSSFEIVIACLRNYRMPEPLRAAHIFAGRLKRASGRRVRGKTGRRDFWP